MENLQKAKQIIEKTLSYDDILLSRVKGLSNTLNDLIYGVLPKDLYEDLQYIDGLSPAKKRAILKMVNDYIDLILNKKTLKQQEKKDIRKLPIERFRQITEFKELKPIEKRALKKVGIKNAEDAFFYIPKRYEDRRLKDIQKVKDGETGTFECKVIETKKINKGKIKVEVVVEQKGNRFSLYFFHDKPFLFTFFRKDKVVKIFGKVKVYGKEKSILQPELLNEDFEGIFGVYSLRGDSNIKITSQTLNHLRRALIKISQKYADYYPDILPSYILEKYGFPDISESIKNIHKPPENENIDKLNDFETDYQKRLIFQELFILQLAQKYKKYHIQKEPSYKIKIDFDLLKEAIKSLPFELTNAQKRVLKEILDDLSRDFPMNRLVQGDVGSGKTVIAALSALMVAKNGYQVAVMAPTEILANQHYKNFVNFLQKFNLNIKLLTGSLSQKEKKEVYQDIKDGKVDIVIGTHALIEDDVEFKNLAFVIIDEQHRFGVEQRKRLTDKSHKYPHTMVMTATPIPRTMALAYFGDLDKSIIDELPKGRKPVKTAILFESERNYLYKKVREEIEKGRQVFVIYPLIEESEKSDLKSAMEGYKHWKEAFPDKEVFLLHGKMKQEEKDRIMRAFLAKEAHILVSTTVIEVGVDVPNASVMVIEEAHRFGLSQIHQLRGRVGRGQYEGFCFLMVSDEFKNTPEPSKLKTLERLKILVRTNDGFKIAEEDLRLRGAGDIAGTAQSGKNIDFSIVDFERPIDLILMEDAIKEAENLIKQDPELTNFPLLKQYMLEKYKDKLDIVNIA